MARNNSKNKCRICLNNFSQFAQLKAITTKTYDDVTYEDLISILSGDELDKRAENIKYPTHICLICEKGILFAYKFKNKLIRANSKLKCNILNEKKLKNETSIVSLYNNKCYRKSNDSYQKTSNESFYTANTDNVEYSKNSIRAHDMVTTIVTSNNAKIHCNICNTFYNTPEDIEKHIREIHIKEKLIYKSSENNPCTRSSKTQKKAEVQLERPRPYTCNICKRTFALKSNLSYHIHSHGNRQTLIKCNHCEKDFKRWNLRRNHIIQKHSTATKFTGITSNTKIKTNLNLENMKYETNQFKDKKSPKTFKNNDTLKYHRTMHIKQNNNNNKELSLNQNSKENSLRKCLKMHNDIKGNIQNRIKRSHIKENKIAATRATG